MCVSVCLCVPVCDACTYSVLRTCFFKVNDRRLEHFDERKRLAGLRRVGEWWGEAFPRTWSSGTIDDQENDFALVVLFHFFFFFAHYFIVTVIYN